MKKISGVLLETISQFVEGFPEVRLAETVNYNELVKGDDSPVFVTLPIAKVDAESRNGRHYDKSAVQAIVDAVTSNKVIGQKGHLRDDERSYRFDIPPLFWVGATLEADGTAWGKAYILRSAPDVREYVRVAKASNAKVGTSIYGTADIDDDGHVTNLQIESVDLAHPGRLGIEFAGAVPQVTSESAVSYQNTGKASEDTDWSTPSLADFTSERWADLSTAEKHRIAAHFAWTANTPPGSYGDLKLPHHRAQHEGIGPAVWRGVSAAMGALMGARGGVEIPSSDRQAVYAHLRRHYAEFKKDPPNFEGELLNKQDAISEETESMPEKPTQETTTPASNNGNADESAAIAELKRQHTEQVRSLNTQLAENRQELKDFKELCEMLGSTEDKPVDPINALRLLKYALDDLKKENGELLETAIAAEVEKHVKVPNVRPIIVEMVKAKKPVTRRAVESDTQDVLRQESIKAVLKGAVQETSGPKQTRPATPDTVDGEGDVEALIIIPTIPVAGGAS